MFAQLKMWWHDHGTKIIGVGTSVLGSLSLIDSMTLHVIEQTFGPNWGHRVTAAIMIGAGLGTWMRGFTNQKRAST